MVLLRYIFVQILSFSFQLWALAMKTTVVSQREWEINFKKCFKKVLWELINLLMSLQIQPALFDESAAFSEVFPPESWKLGVQLIHKCDLYTSVYSMCQVIIWLCDHAMQMQLKTHTSPLLTIESPVAQRLECPARSQRVVGLNPIWNSDFFLTWCHFHIWNSLKYLYLLSF